MQDITHMQTYKILTCFDIVEKWSIIKKKSTNSSYSDSIYDRSSGNSAPGSVLINVKSDFIAGVEDQLEYPPRQKGERCLH